MDGKGPPGTSDSGYLFPLRIFSYNEVGRGSSYGINKMRLLKRSQHGQPVLDKGDKKDLIR